MENLTTVSEDEVKKLLIISDGTLIFRVRFYDYDLYPTRATSHGQATQYERKQPKTSGLRVV